MMMMMMMNMIIKC